MNPLAHILLSKKHSPSAEIEVHLFENCNMSCAFCCQDHKDAGPTQEGLAIKLSMVERFILAKKNSWQQFNVNLMGGELFQDESDDSWFVMYKDFILAIAKLLKGRDTHFCITTNLVFAKTQRVWKLLEELRAEGISLSLSTSYDFVARGWSAEQKARFVENLAGFKKEIDSVSVTLHALSIRKMINDKDPLFEEIYQNFEVNFDWYIPDLRNDRLFHPTDSECRDALIFLAKNYPESHPIKEYLNQSTNSVQCCSDNRVIISANNKYSNCQYMDYNPSDFKSPLDRHSTHGMFERFTDEQGCLSCEHLDRCGFYCWVAADYIHRKRDTDSCFLSEFFREVTS